jgi:hypothetical protein
MNTCENIIKTEAKKVIASDNVAIHNNQKIFSKNTIKEAV